MNASLPDTASFIVPVESSSLDWVGMEQIRLPFVLEEIGGSLHGATVTATADIGVDLPGGDNARKGIHMSRLYRALLQLSEAPLSADSLRQCLQSSVESHADCRSTQALMRLRFDLLLQRSALLTEGESGWQGYAIELEARLTGAAVEITVAVDISYSSTCPCSAALSRQALSDRFLAEFSTGGDLSPGQVGDWLLEHGSLATPHSQRSTATVTIRLDSGAVEFGLLDLIDQVEDALQTPVQTFVKRQDEQAFALRNGSNLMYVEDASRRIMAALKHHPEGSVVVRHFESLHGHDAVARSHWQQGAAE